MSRSLVVAVGGLLLWALPVTAQDSPARLVLMEARLDSLRRAAARADSLAFDLVGTDTVVAGGVRVATSPALRPLVQAAADEAWDRLEARFGVEALAVEALPPVRFGGPESVSPRFVDRHELARGIEGAVAQAVWRREAGPFTDWLRGSFPTGDLEEADLEFIAGELARRPARPNLPCLRGEASACGVALGLRPVADTLAEWYPEAAWPRLADWMEASLIGEDAELRDRCSGMQDLVACRAVLTPHRIAPPISGRGRRVLVELALSMGGTGAFDRLTADAGGTIEQRLEAAAGVPFETLLSTWTASVTAAIPGSPGPAGGESLLVLAWSAVVAMLAIRGSRWR